MDKKLWPAFFGSLAALAIVLAVTLFSGPDDGIEFDKSYGLAYSYLVKIQPDGKAQPIDGRIFDMADRSLPRPSVLVPLRDERGVELTKGDPSLLPNTIRKVRVNVPEKVIEGTVYPAYSYVQWRYHMASTEPQKLVPTVLPAR